MSKTMDEIRESFTPPFRAEGCAVKDSKSYVLCTLSTCMVSKEQGVALACALADVLNCGLTPHDKIDN